MKINKTEIIKTPIVEIYDWDLILARLFILSSLKIVLALFFFDFLKFIRPFKPSIIFIFFTFLKVIASDINIISREINIIRKLNIILKSTEDGISIPILLLIRLKYFLIAT